MKALILSFAVGLSLFFLTGCDAGKNKTNIETFQGMFDQINNKSQDYDELSEQPSNRVPPENTVPRGFKPYKYKGRLTASGAMRNPKAGDFTPETLEVGKTRYEVYCGVCHGMSGQSDTVVAGKLSVKPPTIFSDRIKKLSDGRLYYAITEGYGLMGSYSRQILSEGDRWSVVNYVRHLQKSKK